MTDSTYVEVITPDGGLKALGGGVRRGRNIKLSNHGLDAKSGEGCKGVLEVRLTRERRCRDVALKPDRKAVEGDTGVRLDILQNGDGASSLCIV